jgi:hypothetical protein
LLDALHDWLKEYKVKLKLNEESANDETKVYELAIQNLMQQEKNLETQKGNLHDLLEQGVYDVPTYMERSNNIAKRLEEVREKIEENKMKLEIEKARENAKLNVIPKINHILDTYYLIDDPKEKNILLKSVVDHCLYHKEKHQKNDDFTLIVYPKL